MNDICSTSASWRRSRGRSALPICAQLLAKQGSKKVFLLMVFTQTAIAIARCALWPSSIRTTIADILVILATLCILYVFLQSDARVYANYLAVQVFGLTVLSVPVSWVRLWHSKKSSWAHLSLFSIPILTLGEREVGSVDRFLAVLVNKSKNSRLMWDRVNSLDFDSLHSSRSPSQIIWAFDLGATIWQLLR